jgi:lipoate-protein ligase A
MSLENSLERIAAALEAMVKVKESKTINEVVEIFNPASVKTVEPKKIAKEVPKTVPEVVTPVENSKTLTKEDLNDIVIKKYKELGSTTEAHQLILATIGESGISKIDPSKYEDVQKRIQALKCPTQD